MKCCSSFQLCAREQRGPLTRGTLHPARCSKIKLLRSEWTTNRTRASGDAKATIVAVRIQIFVARRTYETTLDDVLGPFDDRRCHAQISTRWTTPYDCAQLVRPIRTRLPPTRGCAHASTGVHGQPNVCKARCTPNSQHDHNEWLWEVQALLSSVVVIMTVGVYYPHYPVSGKSCMATEEA